MIRGNDPILLTPGPLTTSLRTKQAMLNDWGSWDAAFNAITASLRKDLVDIVGGGSRVHLRAAAGQRHLLGRGGDRHRGAARGQGAGAEQRRVLRAHRAGSAGTWAAPWSTCRFPRTSRSRAPIVEAALAADPAITHVAQVHCETGAGVLNDLPAIAQVCAQRGKGLIVDAMSSFAAIPIDVATVPFDALIAASGKCLEGVPGMGFVIVRKAVLEARAGNAHSLAMDLHDQYVYMEKTTQWRYTPPTHVVAALRVAVDQFKEEGGQPARLARYTRNCETLVDGMAELGFRTFLAPAVQAPIIVTFHAPADEAYDFKTFYAMTRDRGYILYPGKLTQVETFRVGCIGAIDANEMRNVVSAVAQTLKDMGIQQVAPVEARRAA